MKLNSISLDFHSTQPRGQVVCLIPGGSTIMYFEPDEAQQIYNLTADLLERRLAEHAAKINAPIERPLALEAPKAIEEAEFTTVEDDMPF